MKRELNFRLGRGLATETSKAFSVKSLIKTYRAMGLSNEVIYAKLNELNIVPQTPPPGGSDECTTTTMLR